MRKKVGINPHKTHVKNGGKLREKSRLQFADKVVTAIHFPFGISLFEDLKVTLDDKCNS